VVRGDPIYGAGTLIGEVRRRVIDLEEKTLDPLPMESRQTPYKVLIAEVLA